jgi:glycosyltransferase involved in cell wall biosynthesis
MKIAFLTSEYPHPKTNFSAGIGSSIMNLSKGLRQLGHQVTIVIYGQDKDEFFEDDSFRYYKIKNPKLKGISRLLTQKKIQKLLNLLIAKGEIDVVEAVDWTGITSEIKLNCPLILKLHGSDTYFCHLDNRPVKPINKRHEKKAIQNADAIISVSQYTAEVTKQLFSLKKEIKVIPNGIDLNQFSVNETNRIDENTILYFGTLIRKKGLLELPLIFNEVYKKNNEAKLILIGKDASDILTGSSSTWDIMKPLFTIEALQNVHYLGSVPYNEIKNHIDSAAVCVFPTFAEALPVSWLEAMAMQKAIVASDIGWASEIIENEVNGFLVHPKHHHEYANKILELLDNPNRRIQFGVEARKKVAQQFSIDIVSEVSSRFYQSIEA